MTTTCQMCEKRRAKRACPGVHGDICPQCCGEQREVTILCPLDCEFLVEARKHDRPPEMAKTPLPHLDVPLTEQFMRDHHDLVLFTSFTLVAAALETEGAVDADVREALEAMIKTLRTLDTGLLYETRPANHFAAAIQTRVQVAFEDVKARMAEQTGLTTLRDAEFLGVLVFLVRVAAQHDNRRPRGRAFLDFLRSQFPVTPSKSSDGASLVTE